MGNSLSDMRKKKRKLRTKRLKISDVQKIFNRWVVKTRGRCEASGEGLRNCGGVLQCSHILPVKNYPSLRFEPDNVLCLCYAHHNYWWHLNPVDATAFIEKKFGKDYIPMLKRKAKKSTQWTQKELEKIVKKYAI